MFSRRPILISAGLVAIALAATIAAYNISNPPNELKHNPNSIIWREFSRIETDRLVADGNVVLMFGKPGYHVGANLAAKTFEHPEIQRLFHDGAFIPTILEYDDWHGSEISALFREFGHTKHPISLLFVPDREPIKLDPFSPDDILNHIRDVTSTE